MQIQNSCFRVCSASGWVTTNNHYPLRSEPDYRLLCELSVGNFWLIACFCVRGTPKSAGRPVYQRETSRQRSGIHDRHCIANWCSLFPAMYMPKTHQSNNRPSFYQRQTNMSLQLKELITDICALHRIAVGLSHFFALR